MQHEHRRTLWQLTRGQRLRYGAAIAAMGVAHLLMFGVPLVSQVAIDGIVLAEAGRAGNESDGSVRGGTPPSERPGDDSTSVIPAPAPAPAQAAPLAGLLARGRVHLGDTALLVLAALAIVLLTGAAGSLQYLRGRWAATAAENLIRDLRNHLQLHLARLPCAYHDRAETGDLVQRCTSDVDTVRVFLTGQVVEIGRAVLLVGTVLPILLMLHPGMTLASFAVMPVILVMAISFFRGVKRLFRGVDEAESRMTTVLQENLTGVRVVRAFARQDHERARFAERNQDFRRRGYRLIRVLGFYWGTSDFLCLTQVGIVLFVGVHLCREGSLTVGTLFAFLSYVGMIIYPLRQLGRVLVDSGKAIVALGRLGEILTEPEESAGDAALPAPPPAFEGGIEFRAVRFTHGAGPPVVHDLSLVVRPGETIGLVGPPGAGKSTLLQLLLRFYEPDSGQILLDGRPLATLPRAFVRAQIGTVLQEPFLYSRTVRENVRLGRPSAAESEVEEAASVAALHGNVMNFEHGYDTVVGERGVTLSGGQRQRLALSRALLLEPPILLLDDALSAVDTGTEHLILEALRARRARRTTLIVAHRLSTVARADRIVVLDAGRIVEQGTHAELCARPGAYARLWRIQGALEAEIAAARGGDAVPADDPAEAGRAARGEPAGPIGDGGAP